MSEEAQTFRIRTRVDGADIEVEGKGIRRVRSYEIKHDAGHLPQLRLNFDVVDVSEIGGEAKVRVTANGIEFTWEDVETAKEASEVVYERERVYSDEKPEEYRKLLDLADRIQALLSLRDQP